MSQKKVLVVTDYSGNLHITPVGNKAYYQSRNKLVKTKQYKFREDMTETEAEEFIKTNNGKDPGFVNVSKVDQVLAEKDNEIAELRKLLAEKNEGNGSNDNTTVVKQTAKEVIALIETATDAEAVNKLIEGEERKSVLDAATKKLASFGN